MSVSEIQLYQILKEKLCDKEASELVCFVSAEVKNEFDSWKEIFATREDLSNVKADLIKLIYFVALVQFLAINMSILAIINFIK